MDWRFFDPRNSEKEINFLYKNIDEENYNPEIEIYLNELVDINNFIGDEENYVKLDRIKNL